MPIEMGLTQRRRSMHRRVCAWMQRWIAEEWITVLFMVCLVTTLHAKHWLVEPISQLSLFMLSNRHVGDDASIAANRNARVWLVGIDQVDFDTRFGERRPLDRCVLAQDIAHLLSGHPAVLAIDLDLSPVAPIPGAPKPSRKYELDCQKKLDDLLDRSKATTGSHTSRTCIISVLPTGTSWATRRESMAKWLAKRHDSMLFADSRIAFPMRLAINYEFNPLGLAELAQAWDSRLAQARELGVPAPACAPPIAESNGAEDEGGHAERHPISYRAFREQVYVTAASAALTASAPASNAVVFYGNQSGTSDEATTPIGMKHGVDVHAAKFVTLTYPFRHTPLVPFLVELAFAVVISAVMREFMLQYMHQAALNTAAAHARLGLMMLLLALILAAAARVAMIVAVEIAWRWNLVTEPLLVVVGIAVDALVLDSWRHVGASAHEHQSHCMGWCAIGLATKRRWQRFLHSLAQAWRPPGCWARTAAIWLVSRWVIFMLVVSYAFAHVGGLDS
jgi:hypothetical protein